MSWEDIVRDTWRRGQGQSSVGPGSVDHHLEHARALATMVDPAAKRGADLGTGAGIPGLGLAGILDDMEWWLIDASLRRVRLVAAAIEELGWTRRVWAVHARAEAVPSRADWPGAHVVVARLFGQPATTAECAAPLLAVGGQLLVTMSPGPWRSDAAFPDAGLAPLGLERGARATDPSVQELRSVRAPEERFPRKEGVARRRPLW